MSVLVIAEHDNQKLKDSTLNTVTAAKALNGEIDVLVAGENCAEVANACATIAGINAVKLADNVCYAHQLAENVAPLVAELSADYSHILCDATTTGKNLLPRVAAMLDVQSLSDVIAVESEDTFKRPFYAGNVIATVKSRDKIKLLTIRTTAFDAADRGGQASVVPIASTYAAGNCRFVREELSKQDRPELTAAKTVISGGRGMQNGENFEMLYTLADKLGAAVGASRAAVDAGFVSNDMQVGQTGKIVAPDLYMAIGISGAIQHLAGMKDSKVIVAINNDEEAPIFSIADYGLVADLFDAVPELNSKL